MKRLVKSKQPAKFRSVLAKAGKLATKAFLAYRLLLPAAAHAEENETTCSVHGPCEDKEHPVYRPPFNPRAETVRTGESYRVLPFSPDVLLSLTYDSVTEMPLLRLRSPSGEDVTQGPGNLTIGKIRGYGRISGSETQSLGLVLSTLSSSSVTFIEGEGLGERNHRHYAEHEDLMGLGLRHNRKLGDFRVFTDIQAGARLRTRVSSYGTSNEGHLDLAEEPEERIDTLLGISGRVGILYPRHLMLVVEGSNTPYGLIDAEMHGVIPMDILWSTNSPSELGVRYTGTRFLLQDEQNPNSITFTGFRHLVEADGEVWALSNSCGNVAAGIHGEYTFETRTKLPDPLHGVVIAPAVKGISSFLDMLMAVGWKHDAESNDLASIMKVTYQRRSVVISGIADMGLLRGSGSITMNLYALW